MEGMPHSDASGSHLPFGYIPEEVTGIGLPQYGLQRAPRPHPLSRPILTTQQDEALNEFWKDLDQPHSHFNNMSDLFLSDTPTQMPPNYAGFESVVYGNNGQEILDHHMETFVQNNQIPLLDIHSMPLVADNEHYPYMSQHGSSYGLPTPVHSHSYQQPPYQPQGQPLPTPGRGPVPDFGSDNQFSSRGYQPVPPQIETNNIQEPQWLSSAPSTRPNTQPSSPVMSRKRKLEASSHDPPVDGFIYPVGPSRSPKRPSHSRKQSQLRHVKAEPVQEPTPNSLDNADPDSDADAQAESDTDFPSRSRTTSPAPPWPANRPRPSARTSTNASTPAAKSKRKSATRPAKSKTSAASSKANSSRPKAATANRRSSSSATATQQSAPGRRQPLTQEQKKANHTSSEQRRRDAAAQAQARVWDLVPAVRVPGSKMSTVQRLALVNAFISQVSSVKAALSTTLRSAGGAAAVSSSGGGTLGLGLDFSSEIDAGIIDSTDTAAAGTLAGMVGVGVGVGIGANGSADDMFDHF